MSIRQDTDPVPLRQAVTELLELSDLLDGQLRMRLAAFREGYELGLEVGYCGGHVDGVAHRKHAQQDVFEQLQVYVRRWELRGEPRTRERFGDPHPDDYEGREGAA
jgi:hypothetical protein